jgi:hypothetical protein
MSIGIITLRRNTKGGIDVFSTKGIAVNVQENIVRCALGEEDMEYLLQSKEDERHAFSVLESEWKDFKKYKC